MKEEEKETMRKIFKGLKERIEPLTKSPKIQALQKRVIDIRKDAIDNNAELIAIAQESFKENDIDCFIAHDDEEARQILLDLINEEIIASNLNENEVLFIDEIHRLNKSVEEVLYPAMEDYCLDLMIGKGPAARSVRLDLPHFTLVGATTRAGMLSAPLRDRFGMIHRLELYETEDLMQILERDAGLLGIAINEEGLRNIASRSRGTPRIAIRLLKRMRDFASYLDKDIIDKEVSDYGLNALDIDGIGLDAVDRRLLTSIADIFKGGPVGLETLAACTGEDPVTIEDVYEPFLLQNGFLHKTPRGRMLTLRAFEHLGLTPPPSFIAGMKSTEVAPPRYENISIEDWQNSNKDGENG